MLHILLLILKIIGIILAVILGILIVLFAIVVFVPVRYEISAKSDDNIESLKAKITATWLLHLFRVDVFLKGKKVKWKARIAWVKRTNVVTNQTPKESVKDEQSNQESQKVEETAIKNDKYEKAVVHCEEKQETDSKDDIVTETKEETLDKNISKKSRLESIVDKIKDLLDKKEKISNFINNQAHINAYKKVKKALWVLLKRLKPIKIQGKVKFGFEDPSVTGKVLGGISMFYPVFGDSLEMIPDFQNQILKGTLYLRGKIRICHFVSMIVKLILCKDVRITYKDIRNFKL